MKFKPISPVLLSGMVKLLGDAKDDARLLNLTYVAIGKIVRRSPHLVSKDIGLVQKFFDAMSRVCEKKYKISYYLKTPPIHEDFILA